MSLSLYYNTLRYLKPEQLFFQVYYKVRSKMFGLLGRKPCYTYYRQGFPIVFSKFPERCESYYGEDMFCFLNLSHRFDGSWDNRAQGDLWRYNLNYMDYLLQPSMGVAEGYRWIENFIESITDNSIATDPYPISLRGINWIKFVSIHHNKFSEEQLERINTSLYSQYRVLTHHTERHLLANHYLENGFSLLFAAVYFQDEKLWGLAKHIVESQLKEQILVDGAHFELSPMYHCIILERLLDCINLLNGAESISFDGWIPMKTLLRDYASRMLSWMDAIVVKDDTLPLLNDSANGVALSPTALRDYARSLHVEWKSGVLGASGYRHVIRSSYEAILDMAPLGVSYNLGHSHADTSTFLLWTKEGTLLVDTGTSTYNAGLRRDYERSTRAHNAVVVNGYNSSKVWGAFRCAQRAHAEILEDGPDSYVVRHDGYRDKGVVCSRQYICHDTDIKVVDTLEGNHHNAVAYFHLSPEVKIISISKDKVITDRATFLFEGGKEIMVEPVEIAEEYNLLLPSQCICAHFNDRLQTIIEFTIS